MTTALLLRTVRPWRWRWLSAVVLGAAALGSTVALMATAGWLIATAATHPPVLTLLVAVVAVRTFGIGRGVLRYAERLISHDVALRVVGSLRSALITSAVALVQRGEAVGRRSGLLTGVVSDSEETAEILLRGLLPMIAAATVGAAAVVLAYSVLPAAGLVLLLCLLLGGAVVPVLTARRTVTIERDAVRVRAERDQLLAETLDQIGDLVAIGALPAALDRLDAGAREEQVQRRAGAGLAATAAAVGIATTGAAVVLSLLVGGQAVTDGRLGPAWLAVLVLTPLALTELVTAVHDGAVAVARSLAAARRLAGLLPATDADPVPAGPAPVAQPAGCAPVIRLRGVSARWPGATNDALREVDLDLLPGGRVVLVGESGSGKSTLAAVLVGLLTPTAGTITVDGVPVPSLAGSGLLSWADQRAHLFATTIRENLRLARPDAGAPAFTAAADHAGLTDWLAELPLGLDTAVGEHGLAVSGGQRQRIALARAFLSDRSVLVADEIAAHLDEPTAVAVTTAAMRPDPTRCVLLITHRRSDRAFGDTVLELRDGRLHRLAG